ncbi:MAG: MMPL family transporter, partial [Planctomycetes bacterium]|nr:MMPL family transporter [Planctomycetota bacterium]
ADPIGPPVQIYESTLLIKRAYMLAACYAIAAILVLLFLDFRSLADALCAMTPVTIGFVGAFGVMGAVDLPLNFANMIILPVIFGIGVNAGVHIVHRWRAEPYGRPAGLSGATGRGITLTMLTTMIGFGCLLVAEHRGIRSLAVVMLIGLSITLGACYTVLPAILRLRTRKAT